ncbi:hypothetical protein NG819_05870 [Pseudarthrobacter sp. Fe7]|nr:hypothetical protein NG819_05870 [Pseudarthrobacter sp. Fe7]
MPRLRQRCGSPFRAFPELAVGDVLRGEVGGNHGKGDGARIVAVAEEVGRAGIGRTVRG